MSILSHKQIPKQKSEIRRNVYYGVGARNQLYRNNGDGTFSDVTEQAGVGDRSWSWMAVWADVNNDALPHLYVVNGRYPAGEPNTLYLNNGDGTFRNASREAGVAVDPPLGRCLADVLRRHFEEG